MADQKRVILTAAIEVAKRTQSHKLFLFVDNEKECRRFLKSGMMAKDLIVMVFPKDLDIRDTELRNAGLECVRSWAGNQSRFSRIKYAFLHGVLQGVIDIDSKVVCVLGPYGKNHLDTITVHDLGLSWSEEFPFDVRELTANPAFQTVMAVVDIALDIGALGREGKSVGTIFVVGDSENVLKSSHQAVFNPFRGYPKRERKITLPEVVESIKELAKLDGAVVISEDGIVEAAGRMLDAVGIVTKKLRGLGARHRSAAGITRTTLAVAIVVSESTGRVTIFDRGHVVTTLEPLISRRLE